MNIELSKRFVAHPRFQWASGMLSTTRTVHNCGMTNIDVGGDLRLLHRTGRVSYIGSKLAWLDLDDPATSGCLLSILLAEAPGLRLFDLGRGGIEIECPILSGGDTLALTKGGPTLGAAAAECLVALWGEP